MARVRIGSVYGFFDFQGRPSKRGRIGSYLPPRAGTWKYVHQLNLPAWGVHALAKLAPGPERLAAAGALWILASEAANSICIGRLVERDECGRVRAMSDDRIAALLGVDAAGWRRIAALLLPGTGCGVLYRSDVDLDLDASGDGLVAAADLPLFCAGDDVVSQRAPNGTKQLSSYETKTKHPDPGRADAPAGVSGGRYPDPAGLVQTADGIVPQGLPVAGPRRELVAALTRGDAAEALAVFELEAARALGDCWTNAAHGRVRRAFGRVWASALPVAGRAVALGRILDLAAEIGLRSGDALVVNPGAYLDGAARRMVSA